jgi:YVTN family beta-propeller protein
MVIPDAARRWAFVSNTDSDSVAAVQLATGRANVIATAAHPQGGVLSPGGETLYLTATNGNQIAIIDVSAQKVTGAIPTGKGPARVAITPDGRTLVYNLQFEPAVGFAASLHASRLRGSAVRRPLSTMTGRAPMLCGHSGSGHAIFLSAGQRRIERPGCKGRRSRSAIP